MKFSDVAPWVVIGVAIIIVVWSILAQSLPKAVERDMLKLCNTKDTSAFRYWSSYNANTDLLTCRYVGAGHMWTDKFPMSGNVYKAALIEQCKKQHGTPDVVSVDYDKIVCGYAGAGLNSWTYEYFIVDTNITLVKG